MNSKKSSQKNILYTAKYVTEIQIFIKKIVQTTQHKTITRTLEGKAANADIKVVQCNIKR